MQPACTFVRGVCYAFLIVWLATTGHAADQTIRVFPGGVDVPDCYGHGFVNPNTGVWCPIGADGNPVQVYMDNILGGNCFMSFTTPLPPSVIVTRIDVAASVWTDQSEPFVNFRLNNYYAGDSIPYEIANVGNVPSDFFQFAKAQGQGITYKDGVPSLWPGRNDLSVGALAVEYVDLTFHYAAPPTIEFELSDSGPELMRRVLLHKYEPSDTYFSDAQRRLGPDDVDRDAHIEIQVQAFDGNVPAANREIYFRIYDPPDASKYVSQQYKKVDDNFEGSALSANHATTDSNGYARVILRTGGHSAGDNYQIEASGVPFAPTTVCTAAGGCYRSGVITAWKRVYLENDDMLRRGAFLTGNATANGSQVIVEKCGPFTAGQRVLLMQAPRSDGQASAFYAEYHTIADVRHLPHGECRLTFAEPLAQPFFGPDSGYLALGDAVGVLDGSPFTYHANVAYVADAFADAYVDYELLPGIFVPHIDDLDKVLDVHSVALSQHQQFADKWFMSSAGANHQHLIGASLDGKNRIGLTSAESGQEFTYVYVGQIENMLSGGAALGLNGEITVHELLHQWHVNPGITPFGGGYLNTEHCFHQSWDHNSANMTCTGYPTPEESVISETASGPVTQTCRNGCPEWYNGVVRFHFVTEYDNEYTYIRWRWEPIPLNSSTPNRTR